MWIRLVKLRKQLARFILGSTPLTFTQARSCSCRINHPANGRV